MTSLILIPGAFHGAWCWQKLVPLLEARGRRVITPDLPGFGADKTPHAAITLDLWADFVIDLARKEKAPPVLVGHSRAGIVLSQAAERAPEAFARLIYLAAFLVPNGTALAAVNATDRLPDCEVAADGMSVHFRDDAGRFFYSGCSAEDVAWASRQLGPEPAMPSATPVAITAERFGRVPRAYVQCTKDVAILHSVQQEFCRALPCDRTAVMDTDHSPFISAPDALADHLDRLSRS